MRQRDLLAILAGYGVGLDGEVVTCLRCQKQWRLREITHETITFLADHRNEHLRSPPGYRKSSDSDQRDDSS